MRHKRNSRSKPDPTLAAIVRRLRSRNGLTQEDLAFAADITISAMSRIERGLSDPAWTSIRAIAKALGISLDELGAAVELEELPGRGAEA